MKVLMLRSYFYPENCAGISLNMDLIDKLVANNYEVLVSTPIPCRGISKMEKQKYRKIKNEELYNGKLIVKRFSLFYESDKIILRFFRYLIQNLIQILKGLFYKVDIICLGTTPPTMGVVGVILKKIKKIPFIYIVQDVFPDSLLSTKIVNKRSMIFLIAKAIGDITYKNADKLIVISEDIKNNLIKKGINEDKIIIIPNWVDSEKIRPVLKNENPFFDKFNIDINKFNIVYAGNLGNAQDIQILLDAASKLRSNDKIQFIIFGSGNQEKTLKKNKEIRELNNVLFLPLQEEEYVKYVYGLSDVSVVSCKTGMGGSAMPSKTWSIMSCGIPVLAIFDKDTELQKIISDNDIGYFVEAGNLDELVTAINHIFTNKIERIKFGENGRRFIENNLSKDINCNKYLNVFNSLIN